MNKIDIIKKFFIIQINYIIVVKYLQNFRCIVKSPMTFVEIKMYSPKTKRQMNCY